jgi:ribonuclease PH
MVANLHTLTHNPPMRHDGRRPEQLRPVEIIRNFTRNAPGSVLIRTGDTHVFCTATILHEVPPWREVSGAGWVTAEYDMLPGSTGQRRARSRTRVDGRTQEIQRLIGRSLRATVDLARLGLHTIYVDCDVLQADGGTRTAAITGGYVALCDAVRQGAAEQLWPTDVLLTSVAAVSVGMVDGQVLVDLDYQEDAAADVDCNLVMTGKGEWVEVQATGENRTYGDQDLGQMLRLGRTTIERLFTFQQTALQGAPSP